MANTKISDLPGTTTLTDEDAIPVVQEGITKKFTGVLTALKTLLGIGNPETLQTQSKEVVGAVNELNGKTENLEADLEALQGDVAGIPPIFIDTTRVLYDKSGAGTILSYTATEDCYAAVWTFASTATTATLDDAILFITANSGERYSGAWSGFIKKGSVLKSSNPCRAIIYGLKS